MAILLVANLIMLTLYLHTSYVVQSDFSKLGAEELKDQAERIGYKISSRKACLVAEK